MRSDAPPGGMARARVAAALWLLLFASSPGCARRGEPAAEAPPTTSAPASPRSAAADRAPVPAVPSRVPGALDCGGAPCALDDVCLTCGTDTFHCVPAATTCCGALPCPPGNVCVPCPPGDLPTCLPAGGPCPRR